MTDQPEFEELEHIPWAALAAKRPDPRLRIATLVVAGIAVVALCLLVVSVLLGSDEPLVVEPDRSSPLAPAPFDPVTEGTTAAVALAEPAPTTTAVYSEADLMLINVEDEARLAAMQAEWFVRDYLTVDGDISVSARIEDLVPADALTPIEQGSSYVEWVDTFAVVSVSPGEYRVEVVYRLLTGTAVGYVREPVGALAVGIGVNVDGSTRLLALPEGIDVPILLALSEPTER